MNGRQRATKKCQQKFLQCEIEAYVSGMGMLVRQYTGFQRSRAQKKQVQFIINAGTVDGELDLPAAISRRGQACGAEGMGVYICLCCQPVFIVLIMGRKRRVHLGHYNTWRHRHQAQCEFPIGYHHRMGWARRGWSGGGTFLHRARKRSEH